MEQVVITAHMCEVMYAHYDQLINDKELSLEARMYAYEAQLYWIYAHEMIVDFNLYAEELGV
jgi:uncharacterized protein YjaG (DUF416 family)